MIPALLGLIAPSFAPVTTAVLSSQAVAVPAGASTVSIYIVQPGNGGSAQGNAGGDGGPGGSCNWDVALSVAGHSSLYFSFTALTSALWGVDNSGTGISLRFTNFGGNGGSAGGTPFGGGGGGAATELGAGGAGGLSAGGTSVTAGSVLASYVGHGGDGGGIGQNGFDGAGWGAGGGGAGQGPNFSGQGGPSGVLLIFK